MKTQSNILLQYWRQMPVLQKVGLVVLLLSFAASYSVIHTTPAALWNSPKHHAEEDALLTARFVCMMLILAGQFMRHRWEEVATAPFDPGREAESVRNP